MNINYLISVLCLVMWIMALVDCLKSSSSNKLVWIIVIILLPFLGSILWFIMGKSART
jgi:Phospholipase_D-nuclease N-terminal